MARMMASRDTTNDKSSRIKNASPWSETTTTTADNIPKESEHSSSYSNDDGEGDVEETCIVTVGSACKKNKKKTNQTIPQNQQEVSLPIQQTQSQQQQKEEGSLPLVDDVIVPTSTTTTIDNNRNHRRPRSGSQKYDQAVNYTIARIASRVSADVTQELKSGPWVKREGQSYGSTTTNPLPVTISAEGGNNRNDCEQISDLSLEQEHGTVSSKPLVSNISKRPVYPVTISNGDCGDMINESTTLLPRTSGRPRSTANAAVRDITVRQKLNVDGIQRTSGTSKNNDKNLSSSSNDDNHNGNDNNNRSSETTTAATVHAQAFVMAIAFACIWSPQNCMAPNLTQMAEYFHFSDLQRDTFLGAYIALATGVFSLPVSALIGFVGDIVRSRKTLYASTVFAGGLASCATGWSTTYTSLYVSRFICGGCMAGSLPVAFSLLGDFFDVNERNAASAGLTAAMGGGMILGQVLAGMIGPTYGWQTPFYVCGIATMLSAGLVAKFVTDPERGGKEVALQAFMKSGQKYDRKLTIQGFLRALKKNRSNALLITQGFFTSIPWGIIFVFLNDYLSQECGLSVQAATYLVGVFAVGAAIGGIAGGWCGQFFSSTTFNRPGYMPLFMGVSTLLGILPFWAILKGSFVNGPPWLASFYAISAGMIANLPSCNVRPALINVNLPEARGATLTAANLIVNLARGIGPSLLTSLSVLMTWSRATSFEFLLISNWIITGLLLIALSWTYAKDQEWVEHELRNYILQGQIVLPEGDALLFKSNSIDMEECTNVSCGNDIIITDNVTAGMTTTTTTKNTGDHLDPDPLFHFQLQPPTSIATIPISPRSTTSSSSFAPPPSVAAPPTDGSSIGFSPRPYNHYHHKTSSSSTPHHHHHHHADFDDAATFTSTMIEDPQLSFEISTARKSIQFMNDAMKEIPRFWTTGPLFFDHASHHSGTSEDDRRQKHKQDEQFVSLLDEQEEVIEETQQQQQHHNHSLA